MRGRGGGKWLRIRRFVMRRDGRFCMVRSSVCEQLPGRPLPVERVEIDHIVPVSEDPSRLWDLSNLRVACRACNQGRRKPGGVRSRDWL